MNDAARDAGSPTRPNPITTLDSAFFWEGAERGELLAQACADCGKLRHPPRPMCPSCHSVQRKTIRLSGRGSVYSWMIPRHPKPHGFDEPPIVVLVDLEEGIRIVSNIYGVVPEQMKTGIAVEVFFVPTKGGKAVPVFRPRQA